MKYKLLSVSRETTLNIGDYVQALASSQFLPSIDGFIDREKLSCYDGEECKMIMNGWYMHNAEMWPPSNKITPLFVAFHINSSVKERFLREDSIRYLKKHEPIGCRDFATMEMLKEHGVDAYFSACMTLTLGKKYSSKEKQDYIYFTDPYIYNSRDILDVFRNMLSFVFHYKIAVRAMKDIHMYGSIVSKIIKAGAFYRTYSKLFSDRVLETAVFINQETAFYNDKLSSDSERLKVAEDIVKAYSKARYVVTSRIHCALPCIGMGTPVIYVEDANQEEISSCRFGGLRDLFNIITVDKYDVATDMGIKYFDVDTKFENKIAWKPFAQLLIDRCTKFIESK